MCGVTLEHLPIVWVGPCSNWQLRLLQIYYDRVIKQAKKRYCRCYVGEFHCGDPGIMLTSAQKDPLLLAQAQQHQVRGESKCAMPNGKSS